MQMVQPKFITTNTTNPEIKSDGNVGGGAE